MANSNYSSNIYDDMNDWIFEDESPIEIDAVSSKYLDFITAAMKSARAYCSILKESRRGREVIHAESIAEISRGLFEIKLDRKVYNVDSLAFCASPVKVPEKYFENIDERFIKRSLVHLCKYDKTIPSLCIGVDKSFIDIFRTLLPAEIAFTSDLTFLVENMRYWYEYYGSRIKMPSSPSILGIDDSPMYLRGYESNDQQRAENLALTKPISYVWGAPGTGKTQIVLANCLMTYINRCQLVYVVAPTNNAIEQVLRSVIKALQEQGKSIDCLYRLGMASDDFVKQYAKICERFDVQEQINDCKQEIEMLKIRHQEVVRLKRLHHLRDTFYDSYAKYEAIHEQHGKCTVQLQDAYSRLQSANAEWQYASNELTIQSGRLQSLITQQSGMSFFIKCRFSKSFQLKAAEEMNSMLASVNEAKDNADTLKLKCAECDAEYQRIQAMIPDFLESRSKCERQIKDCCIAIGEDYISVQTTKELFDSLNIPDFTESEEIISSQIEHFTKMMEAAEQTQVRRMDEKYVIAFTIDYLISHFQQLFDRKVSHIFLDEAAYCPMIKAGALFSFGVPVTFLGDHMQLPPICEASDTQISSRTNDLFLWAQSSIHFPQIFQSSDTDYLFKIYADNITPDPKILPTASLNKTYRFGSDLANVLNRFVYKNQFEGNTNIQTSIIVLSVPSPFTDRHGRKNTAEAIAIREYIRKYQPKNYAVLTPYKDQVVELQNTLVSTERSDIMTIHRSQGREWDTVIISVSDSVRNKFFTDTTNKRSDGLKIINTAVSRARQQIVIACDYEQWVSLCNKQLISGMIALPTSQVLAM